MKKIALIMIKLNSLSAMQLSGPDVIKFLQGQLTCDMSALAIDHPLRGGHCNKEGRVVALYDILLVNAAVILITPTQLMEQAMQTLKHYAMFSKVTWNDLQNTHEIFADSQGKLLIKPKGEITAMGDEAEFYYQRISQKKAFLTKATVGKFLPQELELEQQGALSYSKGCYLGQEIVARVHYLGKLKRNLHVIESAAQLQVLDELLVNEVAVGEVVESIIYQNRCYALALINTQCVAKEFYTRDISPLPLQGQGDSKAQIRGDKIVLLF